MNTKVYTNENGTVTINMSNRRWNDYLKYERAYKLARTILKAKKECENKKGMSVEDALLHIDTL